MGLLKAICGLILYTHIHTLPIANLFLYLLLFLPGNVLSGVPYWLVPGVGKLPVAQAQLGSPQPLSRWPSYHFHCSMSDIFMTAVPAASVLGIHWMERGRFNNDCRETLYCFYCLPFVHWLQTLMIKNHHHYLQLQFDCHCYRDGISKHYTKLSILKAHWCYEINVSVFPIHTHTLNYLYSYVFCPCSTWIQKLALHHVTYKRY